MIRALLPLALLTSCAAMNSTSRQENQRVEVSLHKIRIDLEEVKHDLNSHQMEMHVLEGRLLNHEDSVSSLRAETIDSQQITLEQLGSRIASFEKRLHLLEKSQDEYGKDIAQLTKYGHETTKAFSQYKAKLKEMEKNISLQKDALKEITKIKNNLSKLSQNSYTVRAGDSLDKIAKANGTTPQTLKKMNKLSSDLIRIGQELNIP